MLCKWPLYPSCETFTLTTICCVPCEKFIVWAKFLKKDLLFPFQYIVNLISASFWVSESKYFLTLGSECLSAGLCSVRYKHIVLKKSELGVLKPGPERKTENLGNKNAFWWPALGQNRKKKCRERGYFGGLVHAAATWSLFSFHFLTKVASSSCWDTVLRLSTSFACAKTVWISLCLPVSWIFAVVVSLNSVGNLFVVNVGGTVVRRRCVALKFPSLGHRNALRSWLTLGWETQLLSQEMAL